MAETALNDEQTELMWQELGRDGASDMRLKAELFDHLCCKVEDALGEGLPFAEAYRLAKEAVIPLGAGNIQAEDAYMLALAKLKPMRQYLYFSTFLCAFLVVAGIWLRIIGQDISEWILLIGLSLLPLVVLPAVTRFFVLNYRHLEFQDKLRMFSGLLGCVCFAVGSMFKILRYPFADMMMAWGLAIVLFLFLPLLFWHLYQRSV